jgi:archaemetzincin
MPRAIHVAWIGEHPEPPRLVEGVTAALHREFGMPAQRLRVEGRSPDALDVRRQQHSSRVILAWLADLVPSDGDKLLGVTDVDLFIPVLTFVFGEAQLTGSAAVVSTARLRALPVDGLLRARLAKESVHEVGHTFGLVHCAVPACVMARSPALPFVDMKDDRLCHDCRLRYRDLREHSYVAARPAHSDR